MKKIKLLMPTLGITLSTISITGFAASCGNNGNIEIVKDDNVTITFDKIEKGKDFVLKFTLTSGYALDYTNSKITFADSNNTIGLNDCVVNETNKTITVKGNNVTSTTVKVEIKTVKASYKATEAEYKAAKAKLLTVDENRSFVITESESGSTSATLTYNAKGVEENAIYTQSGQTQGTYYFTPYSVDNNKTFKMSATSGGQTMTMISYNTNSQCWLGHWFEEIDNNFGFTNLNFDETKNMYVGSNTSNAVEIKFNTSKKITYIKYGNKGLTSYYQYNIDYDKEPTIVVPQESEIMLNYTNPDDYVVTSSGLKLSLASGNVTLGRFEIPMSKYSNWDTSKPLIIKGLTMPDCGTFLSDKCYIYNGSNVLEYGKDYTFTYNKTENITTLTINKEFVKPTQKLVIVNQWGTGGSGFFDDELTISQ